jgi:hypothetical protein
MPETRPKVINGLSFDILQPYEAGHVLTAIEARVLNQTRAENIGNNVRARIKEMQEGDPAASPPVPASTEAEIRAYVTEFDTDYVFKTAGEGSRTSRDPYETEARKLARDLLREKLAEDGRKLTAAPAGNDNDGNPWTDDSWKEYIDLKVDEVASMPAVLAAAKKNVDAKRKQSESLLASIAEVRT